MSWRPLTMRAERAALPVPSDTSMDGEELHRFALRLMAATVGWVLASDDIIAALGDVRP